MKPLLIALALVAAACGSGEVVGGTDPTTTTAFEPEPTQLELLTEARALWDESRPDEYLFTYDVICECVPGPWTVHVDGSDAALIAGPEDAQWYQTIDDIFDEIAQAIDEDQFPVFAEYNGDGVPVSYIFNEPGLASDAGYVVEIRNFDDNPDLESMAVQLAQLDAALTMWQFAGLTTYDYTLTRHCFCPQESMGPYSGTVTDGEITLVTFEGRDVAEIEFLRDRPYYEVAPHPDALFDIVREAIEQADDVVVTYHPQLGYPTSVSIDWIRMAVDDEIGYQLDLEVATADYPASCSTEGWEVSLLPQPGLPEKVAATRRAIFEAAMSCDFARLVSLSDVGDSPLETSFGGSGPEVFWERESEGIPLLRVVVEHLNLPYAMSEDGQGAAFYAWPSAFHNLTSPYGDGIPADEYQALLELYSLEDLEEMFNGIGGYVGWRHVIAADGEWLSFIAGD